MQPWLLLQSHGSTCSQGPHQTIHCSISSATTEHDDVTSDNNMVEVEVVEDNDDNNTLWDKDDVSEAFDEVEDDDE